MKRSGRFFIVGFLVVAVVIVALGVYIFLKGKRPPVDKRETVKSFSFSSAKSLDEWDEKVLAQHKTDYSVTELDGVSCVKAASENSASTLYYKQRLSCDRDPFLGWDWKAEKFPARKKQEALKKKSEFDFVAQVYVIFDARFFLNAKAILYVWTRDLPVGTVGTSPYTKKVKILVLESGETDQWKHEERDIKKDFLDLFGEELEKDVTAISFMTDADSTDSSAVAYFKDFTLGYMATAPGEASDEASGEAAPEKKEKVKEQIEGKKEVEEGIEQKRKEQPSDI
ncbi:DUF3047 domain-containing protein [Candidatus Omnitrophota bacterium]